MTRRVVEGGPSGSPSTSSRRRPLTRGRVIALITPYALLAVPVGLYAVIIVVPFLTTVRLSFYEWNGITAPVWVGLANYLEILTRPELLRMLLHNLQFMAFYTVLPIAVALLLTAMLTQSRTVRGLMYYRAGLFVPYIIPLVVVGVVWTWLYSPINGLINAILAVAGIPPQTWLGDPSLALPAIGVSVTWASYGFALALFIAGIQRIDRSLYDAADVDGAGAVQKFRNVTLPGLRGEIVVVAAVTLVGALRSFDLPYVMTKGGPAGETKVIAFEIFRRGFQLNQIGSAAALATLLMIMVFAVTWVVLRFQED